MSGVLSVLALVLFCASPLPVPNVMRRSVIRTEQPTRVFVSRIEDFRNITKQDLIFNEIRRQVIESSDEKFTIFYEKVDRKFEQLIASIRESNAMIASLKIDLNSKIDASTRESNAKIDSLKIDLNSKIDAKIDASTKEFNAKIDELSDKIRPLQLVYSGGIVLATSLLTFLATKINWTVFPDLFKN